MGIDGRIEMRKDTQVEKPIVVLHRPLGDKTPFPNRQLPVQTLAPQPSKMGKLSMLDPALDKTPGSLLLPSARRKSLRLPRSASKKFTTPMQQGRHWDVSDGEVDPDISTGDIEVQEVEQEDYDEVEYMPPKVPGMPRPVAPHILLLILDQNNPTSPSSIFLITRNQDE